LLFVYGAVVEQRSLLLRQFIGLLYQSWMIDGDDCGAVGGVNEWQGKPKYSEETRPSSAQSTKDPTCLDPGLNPDRRGGKPARPGPGVAFGQSESDRALGRREGSVSGQGHRQGSSSSLLPDRPWDPPSFLSI
jgi:hypothetical protein